MATLNATEANLKKLFQALQRPANVVPEPDWTGVAVASAMYDDLTAGVPSGTVTVDARRAKEIQNLTERAGLTPLA